MQAPTAPTVDELRRRVDVNQAHVPDDLLNTCLSVASNMIAHYVDPANLAPGDVGAVENIKEATYQLAVKVWETGSKGLIGFDAAAGFEIPPPSASAGMVMAVWGLIGPYTRIPVA